MTFRKITSLSVKFTLYTEKNSVKWIFVLKKFMFHFTLLSIRNKNSVMWRLPVHIFTYLLTFEASSLFCRNTSWARLGGVIGWSLNTRTKTKIVPYHCFVYYNVAILHRGKYYIYLPICIQWLLIASRKEKVLTWNVFLIVLSVQYSPI